MVNVKTKVFLQKVIETWKKVEKQRKNRTKVCNVTKSKGNKKLKVSFLQKMLICDDFIEKAFFAFFKSF